MGVHVTAATARAFGVGKGGRRSKYNARKVKADGYTFDSQAEHKRYCELKLLKSAGHIWQLEVHPRYPLVVNGIEVGHYTPDFGYRIDTGKVVGQRVVEEIKGFPTTDYKLRAAVFAALYPDIQFLVNGEKFKP